MHANRKFFILSVITLLTLTGCSTNETSPEKAVEASVSASTSAQSRLPQAGESVEAPGVTLTVDSVSEADHLMLYADGVKRGSKPDERLDAPSGGRFVTVSTSVKNTGLAPWDLTCSFALQAHIFGADGQQFEPVNELSRILGNPECSDDINPGFESVMIWAFAVPTETKITRFGFADPETHYDDLTLINISDAKSTTTTATSAPTASSSAKEAKPVEQAVPATSIAVPVPVDCQMGLGPVVTTWSDGTIGGWSQLCQDINDEVRDGEIAANTPVCDGLVCTYPSGASFPDPNAPGIPSDTSGAVCDEMQCVYQNGYVARLGDTNVPNYLKPGNSPWVQGQIDMENCLNSGKPHEQCLNEVN